MRKQSEWRKMKSSRQDSAGKQTTWVCARKRLQKKRRKNNEREGRQSHTLMSFRWGSCFSLVFLTTRPVWGMLTVCKSDPPVLLQNYLQWEKPLDISIFRSWSLGFRALLQANLRIILSSFYHHQPRTWEMGYPFLMFPNIVHLLCKHLL